MPILHKLLDVIVWPGKKTGRSECAGDSGLFSALSPATLFNIPAQHRGWVDAAGRSGTVELASALVLDSLYGTSDWPEEEGGGAGCVVAFSALTSDVLFRAAAGPDKGGEGCRPGGGGGPFLALILGALFGLIALCRVDCGRRSCGLRVV